MIFHLSYDISSFIFILLKQMHLSVITNNQERRKFYEEICKRINRLRSHQYRI